MEIIISLMLGFLCLATIALPWIHRSKIIQLRSELYTLTVQVRLVKRELERLSLLLERQGIKAPALLK